MMASQLLPGHISMRKIIFSLFLFIHAQAFPQCAIQTGPPPANSSFNTANNGSGGRLPAASNDLHWKVARDSITGTYLPAVVMSSIPSVYYKSPWPDCDWISFSDKGEHTGDKFFFFKTTIELPCFSPCGKSYNDDNTFCVSLDLFADNSIYEIYVNGVPQSGNMGNSIPVPTPYNADGSRESGKIFASLCKNWKAGTNSLVIQVASSATVMALLVQAAVVPLPPIAGLVTASICEGSVFQYRNKALTQAGYYLDTFHSVSGCDSVIALQLSVKPKTFSTVDQTICQGQNYAGHTSSGIYTDTFQSANGCDSIRTLNLTVLKNPNPSLGTQTEICMGDSLLLSPGTFSSYLWQDASTLDHYTVKTPGFYSVTVTNSCSTATAQIVITEKICGIYFPTAFTPNKDGKNELFKALTSYTFQGFFIFQFITGGGKSFLKQMIPRKAGMETFIPNCNNPEPMCGSAGTQKTI